MFFKFFHSFNTITAHIHSFNTITAHISKEQLQWAMQTPDWLLDSTLQYSLMQSYFNVKNNLMKFYIEKCERKSQTGWIGAPKIFFYYIVILKNERFKTQIYECPFIFCFMTYDTFHKQSS